MKTKCLIVDDEPIAQEIIKNHILKLDTLTITGECSNAVEAFEVLHKTEIDLIFLDIQMPGFTGLDFLRSLKNPPSVIIVSAYREYAIDGFDLNVVDYLLKPVSFSRFLKAIDKYYQTGMIHLSKTNKYSESNKRTSEIIWVRADRKNLKIKTDQIRYIEGLKDYVKIYLEDQMIISKISMKELEEKLPGGQFIRIHRSYIVAINKIKAYTNEHVEIDKNILPIGNSYKQSVLSTLHK